MMQVRLQVHQVRWQIIKSCLANQTHHRRIPLMFTVTAMDASIASAHCTSSRFWMRWNHRQNRFCECGLLSRFRSHGLWMSLRFRQGYCHMLNIIFCFPIGCCCCAFLNEWKVKIRIPVVVRGITGQRHGFCLKPEFLTYAFLSQH